MYSQQIKNTRTLQSVSPCCFHERVPQLLCATAVRGQGLHTWREWWQSYGLWQQRVSQTHNLKSFYGQLSHLLLSFEFYGKNINNLFFPWTLSLSFQKVNMTRTRTSKVYRTKTSLSEMHTLSNQFKIWYFFQVKSDIWYFFRSYEDVSSRNSYTVYTYACYHFIYHS